MLWFGMGMGLLLVALGLLTAWLAPRVGPNAIFGFRIGYAYATRETWDRTNRLGGILFALVGLGLAFATPILTLLGLSPDVGLTVLTGLVFVGLFAATGYTLVYARRLARGSLAAATLPPVHFRWSFISPVLVSFGLLALLAAWLYPQFPANVASHFNLSEQPDGWMPRDTFLITFLLLALVLVVLDGLLVLVSTREPVIAFARWGSQWRLSPERGLTFTALAFAVLNLLLAAVLLNVFWFNTRGLLLFPFSLLLWLTVPLIGVVVGFFFLLATREQSS